MASGSASFPPFFPTSSCVHCPGLSPHITSTSRLHCPTSLPHAAAATCLLSVSVSSLSRFPFFYLNVVKKGRSLSGYKKQKKTYKKTKQKTNYRAANAQMSQVLKTHTHPEGGCVTPIVRSSNNRSLQETLAYTNPFKIRDWWNKWCKKKKKDKMLKWKRVVLVSERWRNSKWKLLLLARVGVGGLLIFHIVTKKHFYLIFAGVSGAWWDGSASFEAPADLMGFTFIFFSLLFTRRSTKGNCQSVPIRSFQVGRVQCAGANSATKPTPASLLFFFLFLVFLKKM